MASGVLDVTQRHAGVDRERDHRAAQPVARRARRSVVGLTRRRPPRLGALERRDDAARSSAASPVEQLRTSARRARQLDELRPSLTLVLTAAMFVADADAPAPFLNARYETRAHEPRDARRSRDRRSRRVCVAVAIVANEPAP